MLISGQIHHSQSLMLSFFELQPQRKHSEATAQECVSYEEPNTPSFLVSPPQAIAVLQSLSRSRV